MRFFYIPLTVFFIISGCSEKPVPENNTAQNKDSDNEWIPDCGTQLKINGLTEGINKKGDKSVIVFCGEGISKNHQAARQIAHMDAINQMTSYFGETITAKASKKTEEYSISSIKHYSVSGTKIIFEETVGNAISGPHNSVIGLLCDLEEGCKITPK